MKRIGNYLMGLLLFLFLFSLIAYMLGNIENAEIPYIYINF